MIKTFKNAHYFKGFGHGAGDGSILFFGAEIALEIEKTTRGSVLGSVWNTSKIEETPEAIRLVCFPMYSHAVTITVEHRPACAFFGKPSQEDWTRQSEAAIVARLPASLSCKT